MKKLILILTLISSFAYAQPDLTPLVVNLRDNAKLQFNNNPVKMKGIVISFDVIYNAGKEWKLELGIRYFESNAGAYGSPITTLVSVDGTLTEEEKNNLLDTFADRTFIYSTKNHWVNASGDIVSSTTPGAIPELQYWQSFFLNQVSGVGTVANTKAMDAMYLTVTAIINKLNARKSW